MVTVNSKSSIPQFVNNAQNYVTPALGAPPSNETDTLASAPFNETGVALNNLAIVKYDGSRSRKALSLSPGYQYFPLTQEIKDKVERVQSERQRILHSHCAKNTGKGGPRISHNILVDDKHKFIMCYITKIASTSWRVRLAAQNSTHIPDFYSIRRNFSRTMRHFGIRKLSSFSRSGIEKRLKSYYKFVFVRHPLERILSAYRCLFEEREDNKENVLRFGHFGRQIKAPARKDMKSPVLFHEYINYITSPATLRAANEHWARYSGMCSFCGINYDFIGKFETLPEDISYVLRRLYRGEEEYWFPAMKDPRSAASHTREYYSQINRKLIDKIRDSFRSDFELLDYSADEYLAMAKN